MNILTNKDEYNILIGGIKMKCINIIINKKRNIALLELVQYHIKCFLFTDLEKGDEVKDLLQNSLNFIVIQYPKLKYIELIDNSFIICKNKKRISLPDFTVLKYNKTWYEKYFNAIPSIKEDIKLIKNQIIKKLNKKIKLNYEEFINEYYINPFFEKKNMINIIENNYIKNMKLKDFLDKLEKYDCIFYEKIFNKKIGTLLQGTEWIIKIDTIKEYNINSEIIITEKLKYNNDLSKLLIKLNKLNIKDQKGGNVYN